MVQACCSDSRTILGRYVGDCVEVSRKQRPVAAELFLPEAEADVHIVFVTPLRYQASVSVGAWLPHRTPEELVCSPPRRPSAIVRPE